MRVRKILFDMARDIAERDALRDYDLAQMLRTSRTRASTLLHGHIEKFNSETLIDILARLGVTIQPTIVRVVPYLKRRSRLRVPAHWICE
jgi:predicted XRE-type DNA-binding protein